MDYIYSHVLATVKLGSNVFMWMNSARAAVSPVIVAPVQSLGDPCEVRGRGDCQCSAVSDRARCIKSPGCVQQSPPAAPAARLQPPVLSVPCGAGWRPVARGASGTP